MLAPASPVATPSCASDWVPPTLPLSQLSPITAPACLSDYDTQSQAQALMPVPPQGPKPHTRPRSITIAGAHHLTDWYDKTTDELWEAVVEEPMAGTIQAPPPEELTRATYVWRDALVDVLRTHQAPPGSDEATRQRAASVKAYAAMGVLLRRAPEAIRDARKGRQG